MKAKLYQALSKLLDVQIKTAESAIRSAIESRDNETKSSVGDKYETGRAMMQLEQQKGEAQLAKAVRLKQTLDQISLDKKYEVAEFGSLVETTQGLFFLSVGIGKVEIEGEKIFAVSMASPIGQHLLGKTIKDSFDFQNRNFEILSIK